MSVSPNRIASGRGKYCSKECHNNERRGETLTERFTKPCLQCGQDFVVIYGYRSRLFCGYSCSNRYLRTGVKKSNSHIAKLSGRNHYNWRGGITSKSEKIRKSLGYKTWRKSVFERDNYTCQICRKHGGSLQADHIKPFCIYPELRLSIDNGRTLCKPCHLRTGTWGINALRYNDESGKNILEVQEL